jgi:hypothetical protein
VPSQVHAVRSRRKSNVESVVDDNPRTGAAHGLHTRRHQLRQQSSIEVTFPHLYEMNAFARRERNARHERIDAADAEPPAIGDQTKDRIQGSD